MFFQNTCRHRPYRSVSSSCKNKHAPGLGSARFVPLSPAFLTALWDLQRITLLTRHRGPTRLCPGPLQLKFQAPRSPRPLRSKVQPLTRGALAWKLPVRGRGRKGHPAEVLEGEGGDPCSGGSEAPLTPPLPEGRPSPCLRVGARQLALAF